MNDYHIPNSSLTIEKGTIILISLFGLHHDPDNFSNPEIFDPDRFLPENNSSIRSFTYLPFGEGLRICIGEYIFISQESEYLWFTGKPTL